MVTDCSTCQKNYDGGCPYDEDDEFDPKHCKAYKKFNSNSSIPNYIG